MKLIGPKCSCDCYKAGKARCPIMKLSIFSGVPEAAWDNFFKKRISNDYRKGNIIFYEGNRPFGIYFLCKGRVKIVRTDSGLHSSIPRVKEAPCLLGERAFLANEAYRGTGEAMEDCRICFIDTAYFEKLFLEDPKVCRSMLAEMSAELGRAEEHLLDLGFKTVKGRLAKHLLEESVHAGSASIELPSSRGDLAKILGTSPEVLCRLLAEFRRKAWITVSGRSITIKDRPRLEQVSRR